MTKAASWQPKASTHVPSLSSHHYGTKSSIVSLLHRRPRSEPNLQSPYRHRKYCRRGSKTPSMILLDSLGHSSSSCSLLSSSVTTSYFEWGDSDSDDVTRHSWTDQKCLEHGIGSRTPGNGKTYQRSSNLKPCQEGVPSNLGKRDLESLTCDFRMRLAIIHPPIESGDHKSQEKTIKKPASSPIQNSRET